MFLLSHIRGHLSDTHLVDCANWAVSAAWTVPKTAVSGLYFARLVREDQEKLPNWRGDGSKNSWDIRFSRQKKDQDPLYPPPLGAFAEKNARGGARKDLKIPKGRYMRNEFK